MFTPINYFLDFLIADVRILAVKALPRKHDYPIIRFLVGSFYVLAFTMLIGGLAAGAYLWIRAEALRSGNIMGGPLAGALNAYDSPDLCMAAAVVVGGGLLAFLVLGSIGQVLAMQRDRAIGTATQVMLLEDILELNEQASTPTSSQRVELCEGCGKLGSLQRIDSGQWVCRNCRHALRSA